MPFAFGPLSRRPFSTLNDLPLIATLAAGVGAVIIYAVEIIPASGSSVYAATEQYATFPGDSPPNTSFNGTLEKAPSFRRSIVDGQGFGRMSSGFGELEINNASGEYDALISGAVSGFDGARVIIKMGWRDISYDRFVVIFDGLVETAEISEESVRLTFKDDNKRLEIPVQPNVYGGTGTVDGDANVQGKRRPLCPGLCRNVPAPLIDEINLVYQVHDGEMFWVHAVYDNGVALTQGSDYATYAALISATIVPGSYGTCLALGLVRLGALAFGQVTVTAQGAVGNGIVAGATAGAALTDTASLVHYLISISPAAILVDTTSILAVKVQQPAAIGRWIGPDESITLRQVIDELMDGIGGWGGFRADRTFNIGIFTLPTANISGNYTNMDWFSFKRVPLPSSVSPPPYRFRAAYSRNFTIQEEIDAPIDAGTQTNRKDPYSIATSSLGGLSADIQSLHPSAQDPEIIESWFVSGADAVAECNRRLILYGAGVRSLYRFDLTEVGYSHDIGSVVQITDSRFGLSGGKSLTVVEIEKGFDDNQVALEAFG